MKRFERILCVTEDGSASRVALEHAVTLAKNSQARLTVVAIAEPVFANLGADLPDAMVQARLRGLERLVSPYRKGIQIDARVLVGIPFVEVIREVLRLGHDLVVKEPDDPDWLDRLFSSDDMHLMRKCPCPVWLVKPKTETSYRRILAAVDPDQNYPPEELAGRDALNLQILEMASSLAVSEFAELHVVHAWEATGESTMRGAFMHTPEAQIRAYVEKTRTEHAANLQTLLDEVADLLGEDAVSYIKPRAHLLKGSARKEVPALAKTIGADLVVMGTVGRTGIRGFVMGNTAESILSQLTCSVLAIKPPGFKTPVAIVD